jgi:Rod binding domain-containing protein
VRAPAFRDELRESAEKLVASALLMPVLEQMTNSPLRPEDGPFAESTAEKRFGPLLHQHFADRMMQSRSFGLVDAVVDRLSREGKPAPALSPTLEFIA